jgi:hypothetical protein
MESEGSLLCSVKPTTQLYPESDEFSPYYHRDSHNSDLNKLSQTFTSGIQFLFTEPEGLFSTNSQQKLVKICLLALPYLSVYSYITTRIALNLILGIFTNFF